jgi:hypothetical protein
MQRQLLPKARREVPRSFAQTAVSPEEGNSRKRGVALGRSAKVEGMGIALAAVLVAFASAHVALVVGLASRRQWWRATVAAAVLPLAPWWGWAAGMRRRTIAWGASLLLYAIGIAIA